MPPTVGRRLCTIRFTKRQQEQLKAIWEHEAFNNVDFSRAPEPEQLVERRWKESGNPLAAREDVEDSLSDDVSEDDGDEEDIWREGSEEDRDEMDEEDQDDEDEDDGCNPLPVVDNATTDQLLELLFQLSVTFSTEQFMDVEPSSSMLVFFSGILGFTSDAENFLPAKSYTPYLSGLIYIERLLFLEYALPFRAYPHLGIPRRPRRRQYERLDAIRQRYMVTGSESPLEEFQSLRDFGRVVARSDPPSFLLHWSDDGKTVFMGDDFSLTMESYRRLAEYFISRAEELCAELLLGLDVPVDLTQVKDDMTDARKGTSFIQHPDNGLLHVYLDLSKQACTTRAGLFKNGSGIGKPSSHTRGRQRTLTK
jgi:hypothetical protein